MNSYSILVFRVDEWKCSPLDWHEMADSELFWQFRRSASFSVSKVAPLVNQSVIQSVNQLASLLVC